MVEKLEYGPAASCAAPRPCLLARGRAQSSLPRAISRVWPDGKPPATPPLKAFDHQWRFLPDADAHHA
ncbi:MAG: hypothetical protein WCA12_20450, partial [Burkholderiales bacterium]